ncbi:MAG: FAD-dependent oxidoreductase [Proteobacteria bacterium]|nr:FAD-dependent oxidoreductase [Pseudomonadota bacterium]
MTDVLTPDICVIGGGSGGLSVAAAAAAFGVPVVLIEKGKMGGDCLNYGCVPSKAMIAAGRQAASVGASAAFGVRAGNVEVAFDAVHRHVHGVIAAIAPNDSKERFAALGVRVISGAARFRDADTVVVGDSIAVKARRFVVATGSSPAAPPIPGLAETPHLTNETIFDLTERPEHLIVIGAGPIGLELAQSFRRLGAQVTVIEALTPLAKDDPECAAIVIAQLEREGVVIRAHAKVTAVGNANGKVAVTLALPDGEETIEGSHLLVAAGRKPNVGGLDLEASGIAYERTGIKVDAGLRTTNKKVYAIGDVAGALQFTHVANYHAGLVIRNALFRLPVKARYGAIPWVTFTDPEMAHVGLTEAEATKHGHKIRILRWPYHENDRAQAEREIHGHVKVITSKRGKILGATIVGASAGELIGTWTLAITQGLNIRALTGFVVPYPTLGEISKRAAITYFTPGLTSPLVRRIIGFLRRFG